MWHRVLDEAQRKIALITKVSAQPILGQIHNAPNSLNLTGAEGECLHIVQLLHNAFHFAANHLACCNKLKQILNGIIRGCNISDCSLIGGETAEMPGIYDKNKFDLAGFSVGVVSKKKMLHKKNVQNGDVVLAIPSSGIHSNGYSLIRSIIENKIITKKIKKELLAPTKIYVSEILNLTKNNLINSAAHITGGGLVDNLSRSVPEDLCLNLDLAKVKTNSIFKWIKSNNINDREMLKTFNCGVGFCLIAKRKNMNKIKKYFSKRYVPYEIGFISKDKNKKNIYNKIRW